MIRLSSIKKTVRDTDSLKITDIRVRFIDDPEAKLIDSFGKTVKEAVDTYVFDKVPKNKVSKR